MFGRVKCGVGVGLNLGVSRFLEFRLGRGFEELCFCDFVGFGIK